MRKLKLYSLGGAGCNIGTNFLKFANKQTHGYADIECVFVDTSKSNLNPNIPADQIYLVDGLDGSGKLRASNFNVLNERANEILHQFKPADVNIVLSSGSGGSGSVLAPILASEMLSRGELVIVITIGGTSSRIEAENTLKTLKSYEVISQKRQTPVIMAYRENSVDTPRAQVDGSVEMLIISLAIFFSGNNRELDMSDLRNFVNYDKVTSYKPKLSYLEMFEKEIILGKGQALVSLVTLVDDKTSSEIEIPAEYQAVGYVPSVVSETINSAMPLHAAVITGYFNGVVDRLESKLGMYAENRKAVIEKSIATSEDHSTENGVVL